MAKITITMDIGDITDFISPSQMQEMIIEKIESWAKAWFREGVAGYAKEQLYHQMARYADKFLETHPDIRQMMDANFREMAIKPESFAYYMFSAPQSYDAHKARPGYELIKEVCADSEVRAKIKQNVIDYAAEHFERLDSAQFCREIGYQISTLLQETFTKEGTGE